MYCPPETVKGNASIQLGAAYQSLRDICGWLTLNKASLACEHFEPSYVVLCCSAKCHSKFMKQAVHSDATGYNLSRLKLEPSWVLIQVELQLAEPILSASTLT